MKKGKTLDSFPENRNNCKDSIRPCPWVRCNHHLLWALALPWTKMSDDVIVDKLFSMQETCELDVTDRGEVTLEEVGAIFNITRERVRQIESGKKRSGLTKLKHGYRKKRLRPFMDKILKHDKEGRLSCEKK